MNWYRGFFRVWLLLSILWIGGLTCVIGYQAKVRYDWQQKRAAELKAEGLPPCKSGALDCDPWERDWKGRELPIGTIVREKRQSEAPAIDAALWYALALPPAIGYAALRALTWTMRGFHCEK
jgi:hypothetical protein